MVQKIHPRGVIWGPYFPPQWKFKKTISAECSVYLYSSPWIIISLNVFNSFYKLKTNKWFFCNNFRSHWCYPNEINRSKKLRISDWKYMVSHIKTCRLNWFWQIEICKLEFVWRWFWYPEIMYFEFHQRVFKKVK